MAKQLKTLGHAKRIRIRRFAESCSAWDCRPFGFGRIVAPITSGVIEIAPEVHLDLATGELQADIRSQRRSA